MVCITRIENLAERLPVFLSEAQATLTETQHQLKVAMQAVTVPFDYEDKLSEFLTRQTEINTKLEFKELSKQQDELLNDNNDEEEDSEVDNDYEEDIAV
jgi:hypothetical protein